MSATRSDRSPAGGKPFEDFEGLAVLLERARGGDRAALGEAARRLAPLLWQVARAQGLDRERSADAVQTAWLSLLGSLAEIHTPIALTSWLITVTKRTAWRMRDENRVSEPITPELVDHLTEPGPAPDDLVVLADRRARLWDAVGRLPSRCRELLRVVAFVSRPDYEKVSAALGMPRGSIGPTRGRCLTQLRNRLLAEEKGSWR